jgi:hypothetical protein
MSKDDTNARLAALERENAELRERLSRLENPPPKVAPPRREEDRVRILNLMPGISANMPDEDESRALLKIVHARHPRLKCKYDRFLTPDDEHESFRAALAYVFSLTKTEKPTTAYSHSWWISEAKQWCQQVGVYGNILSLMPAIIATGDVNYSMDDFDAVWLHPYRSGKTVDDQKWCKVLNGGDLIAPTTRIEKFVDHSIGVIKVHDTARAW